MARGYSLGAFVKEVYNLVYPVGICIDFDNATDPNTAFPGTTWTQITDACSVRAATSSTVGSAPGNIGATDGSDTVTIGAANMPVHNHSFGATSSSVDLGTKTVSTYDYGTKTTDTTGAHTHTYTAPTATTVKDGDRNQALASMGTRNTDSSGDHAHTVVIGAHSHNVVIGAHAHTVNGTTDNAGGTTALDVTNRVHYYARWKRTA